MLYRLCGDNLILKREWLNTSVIEFLNHLSLRKEVAEFDEREFKRRSKLH